MVLRWTGSRTQESIIDLRYGDEFDVILKSPLNMETKDSKCNYITISDGSLGRQTMHLYLSEGKDLNDQSYISGSLEINADLHLMSY